MAIMSCSSSESEEPNIEVEKKYNFVGKTLEEINPLPFKNKTINTDPSEIEKFKKYIANSFLMKGKYSISEQTKDSTINYILALTNHYRLEFKNKEECTLYLNKVIRYTPTLYSVYNYECQFNREDVALRTSSRIEILSPLSLTYNDHVFKLLSYMFQRDVFTKKQVQKDIDRIITSEEVNLTYSITPDGSITFIDNKTKALYHGKIKDNAIHIDFKLKENGGNVFQ